MIPEGEYLGMDDTNGVGGPTATTAELEELSIVSENDPNLGLTAHGDVPADDWAADTGPDRNPDRGVATDNLTDDRSTLAPDK
jgi:hypothetical protein